MSELKLNIYEALRTVIRQSEVLLDCDRVAPKEVNDKQVLKIMKFIFEEYLAQESFNNFANEFFRDAIKEYFDELREISDKEY